MAPKKSKTTPAATPSETPLPLEELRNARRDRTLKLHRLGVRVVRRGDGASRAGPAAIAAVPLRIVGPDEGTSTSVGEGDITPEPPMTEREMPWDSPVENGRLRRVVPFLPWLERAVAKKYVAAAEIIYGIEEADGYWLRTPRDNDYIIEPPADDGHSYIGVYLRQLEYGLRFPLHPFITSLLNMYPKHYVGDVVVATCMKKEGKFEVDMVEAMAMRYAVKIALESGFDKLCLETDNLKLFYALRKGNEEATAFGMMVTDILKLLNGCRSYSFSFVKRDGNRVAHQLAQLSTTSASF